MDPHPAGRGGALPRVAASESPRLLLWAAEDPAAEADLLRELAARLNELATDDRESFDQLADEMYDRASTGAVLPVRGAVVACDREEAWAALERARPGRTTCDVPRPVALLLPGQGAQHQGMALGLYEAEPVFTAEMDAFFGLLGEEGARIRSDWLSERPKTALDDISRAQPLLYAVGHAVGRMLISWGIRPAALLGHSAGEVAAATLAGVFRSQDAAMVMAQRVAQLAHTPPGGMLAVAASREELAPYIGGNVAIGAVNAPQQTMLAGPDPDLSSVESALRSAGFTCRRAKATVAFHSPVMAQAAALAEPVFAAMEARPPDIPLYSGYTAAPLCAEEALSARFWARQPAAPVLFAPALDALLSDGDFLLLDGGPGQTLATLARRHPAVTGGASDVAALLPRRRRSPYDDVRATLAATGRIWAEGHALDLQAVARLG